MDDPWGSPWAEKTPLPIITTKEQHNAEGNERRSKIPVKPLDLRLEEKVDSPWDGEDDVFGEWGAVPAVKEAKRDALGFDGAGDAWESRSSGGNMGSVKDEVNGSASRWNDRKPLTDDHSPKLDPSLMPRSTDIVRQLSPDPWVADNTSNADDHKEDLATLKGVKKAADNQDLELNVESLEGNDAKNSETSLEIIPGPVEKVYEIVPTGESGPGISSQVRQETAPDLVQTNEEIANSQEPSHESSRSSSSPSDRSHRDEILPESPRTSFDEEPKRSQVCRKVSSKIQELVEHFDGLAKQDEELVIEPSRSRSRSNTPSTSVSTVIDQHEDYDEVGKKGDQDDDFGDFEDGQSEKEDSSEEEEPKDSVMPAPAQSPAASNSGSNLNTSQTSPSRSRLVKKDFGRVEYAVDATTLEKFFSQRAGDVTRGAAIEKVFIMDVIPYDSFSSMEERKTWYRISRSGSVRKHNSGNDQNYIRVTWPQSQIRDQTLVTVARWMEEDRNSARVVLGGGSKGSSIFGWNDPNSPAVPLSSAFAPKPGKVAVATREVTPEIPREWPEGLVRDRSSPKSRSSPKAKRRSAASIAESHNTQVPVAKFGWNTSPTTSEQSSISLGKEATMASPITMKAPSSLQSNLSNTRPAPSSIVVPLDVTRSKKPTDMKELDPILTSKSIFPILPPTLTSISDDDDEWGEMVASPVVTAAPTLTTQGVPRQKLQSLSGAFSPPLQVSPIESPSSTSTTIRGDLSVKSSGDIVVPKPSNLTEPNSDLFWSGTFAMTSPSSSSPPVAYTSSQTTSTTSNNDPWASADFSFFDNPARTLKTAPASVRRPTNLKPIPFAKAPPAPSPLRHGKTRLEVEQDEMEATIVKRLPDLSYMLQ